MLLSRLSAVLNAQVNKSKLNLKPIINTTKLKVVYAVVSIFDNIFIVSMFDF